MSVSLARRLVSEGLVASDDVNAALLHHVTERAAFLEALTRRRPELAVRLESELGSPERRGAIVPDVTLVARLPVGLMATLLAVPVGRDPETRAVAVVAADGSDPHVAAELSHHFGEPVRVSSAPLGLILAAVAPRNAPDPRAFTPAFGTSSRAPGPMMPRVSQGLVAQAVGPETVLDDVPVRPSDPPIPLVRLSPDAHAPATVKGVAPQASGAAHASRVVVPPRAGGPAVPEPVIALTRTKTGNSVIARVDSLLAAEDAERFAQTAARTPDSGERALPNLDVVLNAFELATSPEDIVTCLLQGLTAVAARVIVLAVRGKVYEGRDASDASTVAEVRTLVVSGDRPSVLQTAAQLGHYFGPIPQTLVHADLSRLLGDPPGEIAVASVSVSGRPALIYVMAGMQTAYIATRAGERLAEAASDALSRIVRQRKR